MAEQDNATEGNPYESSRSPLEFAGGKLKAFRPELFLPFFREISSGAEQVIISQAMKAWVICPTKIIRSDNRDSRALESLDFIHAAVSVETLKWLSAALDRSREQSIEDGVPLLGSRHLQSFPWEILFGLGGLANAVNTSSIRDLNAQLRNQRLPVVTVATVVHALHQEMESRSKEPDRRETAVHRAQCLAAETVSGIPNHKNIKDGTARNYWEPLLSSAPLIYAAALTSEGQMLRWLINDHDDVEIYPEVEDFALWFGHANAIAAAVLGPFKVSNLYWVPLQGADLVTDALPPSIPKADFIELLSMCLAKPIR